PSSLLSRGRFVIYDIGILRQIPINDLPVACSVDETLRLVQAFQHTDMFGEVCPAGWRPGHPEEQGVFLQTELIPPHLLRGATSIQRTN
uniref:thioredoxin-dependent peroxiredoxin n=1 Tax=Salmo trutta TaxID=8032 RepID=A0A673ZDJ7_SALTR